MVVPALDFEIYLAQMQGLRCVVRVVTLMGAFLLVSGSSRAASWVKAYSGPFEAVSDDGRTTAVVTLNQFEQFRYALGTILGKPDLTFDPPVRILIFKTSASLAEQKCTGLMPGRERVNLCVAADQQLSPEILRSLTKVLIENNFPSMPQPLEHAMEVFFSTFQAKATHVLWGGPPDGGQITRDWALLHFVITNPETAARARIYLHNLASGMDRPSAIKNAFGKDATTFDAEVERHLQAGKFEATAGPSRPINPNRDFHTTQLTSDEGILMQADLLNGSSESLYRQLLQQGKEIQAANEGLGLLAERSRDLESARNYFQKALDAGSKNVVMMTKYAAIELDAKAASDLLLKAIAIDPKYAPARWTLGEKTLDPRMRLFQWKKATELSPRNWEWWAVYASACLEQKQYAEAGRAWVAAAQSAPDEARREQFFAAREKIAIQKLDQEDGDRRREQEANAREIEQLKAKARKEIADLESRVNKNPISSKDKIVDWADVNGVSITGNALRYECQGAQRLFHLRVGEKEMVFAMPKGDKTPCGALRPQTAVVTYIPAKAGVLAGDVLSIELKP